jgi:TPR repeat protein
MTVARLSALALSGLLVLAGAAPAHAMLPLCHPVSKGGTSQSASALSAYKAQRYTVAFSKFRGLAESGNPYAQNHLAIMYNRGYGVARNYRIAAEWWEKAAQQGQVTAQCNLGMMYLYGQGVPQDDVLAYAYFSLAAGRGSNDARRRMDMMEAWRISRGERAEAQELAHEWMNGNFSK